MSKTVVSEIARSKRTLADWDMEKSICRGTWEFSTAFALFDISLILLASWSILAYPLRPVAAAVMLIIAMVTEWMGTSSIVWASSPWIPSSC